MKLTARNVENGIVSLHNTGEIRLGDRPADKGAAEALLGPGCYTRKVLFDLKNTSFIDSAGVGWIVRFHKLCEQSGGMLVLHSPQPAIVAILRLLHMDRFLHIVDDEAAARAMAGAEAPAR
ncbi:Putative anti-sigma factor antagonist [Aquisphaera giovannonii]|uniref:Anti-sigma factor antagonist n=1 Tax=Aquisphaera giovannonii TaxID=406548 RepID=A0A5B9WEE8_9BACT|nr:STAS domain-containing protein [Aquisphaera giovannonii]QEH38609.1 Putative anti-sigma factor antagonist [Aquisphaera giovannonii]